MYIPDFWKIIHSLKDYYFVKLFLRKIGIFICNLEWNILILNLLITFMQSRQLINKNINFLKKITFRENIILFLILLAWKDTCIFFRLIQSDLFNRCLWKKIRLTETLFGRGRAIFKRNLLAFGSSIIKMDYVFLCVFCSF